MLFAILIESGDSLLTMARERDDFSGRYTRTFSLSDFVDAVEEVEIASTQHVADEVGCSYDLAYRRLKQLEEENRIKVKKIGNTYHWLPLSNND